MTLLDIVLGAMVIFITLLWITDQYRWAKREGKLLDRVMAKHFQEYMLGEDLRKKPKVVEMPPIDSDRLPIT